MNKQPKALRLADALDDLMQAETVVRACHIDRAAYALRRLHAENERLREALHDISISQNSMYQEARAKQALGEDQNIWRMCGLNTDDVIKMAEEAGIVMSLTDDRVTLNKLNRFLELHLKALRNEGYRKCAEGQRTTQFCGLLDAAVKAEREACAKADTQGSCGNRITQPVPQQVKATAQKKGGDKLSPASKSMRTCKYCNGTYTANAFTTRTGCTCKWCAEAIRARKDT